MAAAINQALGLDFADVRREGVAGRAPVGGRAVTIGPDGEEPRSWT